MLQKNEIEYNISLPENPVMMIIKYLYTKSLVIPTGLLAYDKVFIYLRVKFSKT